MYCMHCEVLALAFLYSMLLYINTTTPFNCPRGSGGLVSTLQIPRRTLFGPCPAKERPEVWRFETSGGSPLPQICGWLIPQFLFQPLWFLLTLSPSLYRLLSARGQLRNLFVWAKEIRVLNGNLRANLRSPNRERDEQRIEGKALTGGLDEKLLRKVWNEVRWDFEKSILIPFICYIFDKF